MIFVTAEETGFLGCLVLLGIYAAFGMAGLMCQRQLWLITFASYVIGGFTCLIIGQMLINVAVVTALMPITGITLPFISYGGSSLLVRLSNGVLYGAAAAAPRTAI